MLKKQLIIGVTVLFICIGLSGCYEQITSNEESSKVEDSNDDNNGIETIIIDAMQVTQTIDYLEKPVKLVVEGMNCVITVTEETNLVEVFIMGVNSIVKVSRNHSFTSEIHGMNAKIDYYD